MIQQLPPRRRPRRLTPAGLTFVGLGALTLVAGAVRLILGA